MIKVPLHRKLLRLYGESGMMKVQIDLCIKTLPYKMCRKRTAGSLGWKRSGENNMKYGIENSTPLVKERERKR